jgi:hypothetical protein
VPCLSWVQFCFMMGATVAGPVPIIVANAVTVPMTYCFDIIVKGVEFSTVSLTGAVRMLRFVIKTKPQTNRCPFVLNV